MMSVRQPQKNSGSIAGSKNYPKKNTLKDESLSKKKVLKKGPLESMFPCSESKILDFLVTFQDYDYSISDIADNSGVGFKTTLGIIKHLEKQNVVINTRKVGRAIMYKLNLDSKQSQSISRLAMDIAIRRAKGNRSKSKKSS